MVTDSSGRSVSEHDYYAFGVTPTKAYQEQINWGDPHIDAMRFAGHQREFLGFINTENTDYLDYMHARYYDPNMGRFLSVDPTMESADLKRPQSWNRYSYVLNSPINALDPDGRQAYFVAHSIAKSDQAAYERGEITRDEQIRRSEARLAGGAATVAGLLGGPALSRALDKLALNVMMRLATWGGGGAATAEGLRRAASSGGATTTVVTNLTRAPQEGRALYAASGEGAQLAANAARSGPAVRTFVAQIPQALLKALQDAKLVEVGQLVQKGSDKIVTQYRFAPEATEYILKFFTELK
jgi:RHS repeat-associated core domain